MKISKTLVLSLALLFGTSAFAAAPTSGTLSLDQPAQVSGTQLAAGDYKVQWEGNGPNVEVKIMKGKNVVATVPGHVMNLQTRFPYNAAIVSSDQGKRALTEIRFSGRTYSLALGEESGTAGSK